MSEWLRAWWRRVDLLNAELLVLLSYAFLIGVAAAALAMAWLLFLLLTA